MKTHLPQRTLQLDYFGAFLTRGASEKKTLIRSLKGSLMKTGILTRTLSFVLALCLSATSSALGQSSTTGIIDLDKETGSQNERLAGSIDVDLTEEKKEIIDPYQLAQDGSIDYFTKLVEATSTLPEGNKTPIESPKEGELLHLNGLYLYCVIQNGTCPEILDAILEIDVINSKLSGKPSCPILKSFWKSWIRNKMEKRHKHHVKIGLMKKTLKFKRNDLPRYLKCTSTVREELAEGNTSSTAAYFKARYSDDELYKDAIVQTLQKLEAMKGSIANVFEETE